MEKREAMFAILFLGGALALVLVNRNIRSRGFEQFIYKEAVFYLAIPLVLIAASRKDPGEFGLCRGDMAKVKRYFVALFLLAIPFMLIGSSMLEFQLYYPRFYYSTPLEFLAWEALIGLLMLSTEFFYRGFMMFGLKGTGRLSILIQAIPYAYIHLGKPMIEVYYSFFAGLAFGYVDYESKSILPSFLLHWTTSIVFDALCVILAGHIVL